MQAGFIQVGNGEAVARERIPHLSFDEFRHQCVAIVANGGKVVQCFAYPDADKLKLIAVLRNDQLLVAGCDAPRRYAAMTAECEPFHLFEREMAEQYGLRLEGHPWFKMVRYHANYRGKPDLFNNDYGEDIPGNYDYYAVHEVAVGPVHAGVIEPGHFRFNCIGERVLHLEIQLGYQHRGVEQLLLNSDPQRWPVMIEGIAGDTSIGHSLCMAQAMANGTDAETVLPNRLCVL